LLGGRTRGLTHGLRAVHFRWRRQLFLAFHPSPGSKAGLSTLNKIILGCILASVSVAVLETEPMISDGRETLFFGAELAVTTIFLTEYLLRLWVCVEDPNYGNGLTGRLRYAVSPHAIFDLIALSSLLSPAIGTEAFLLRLLRLLRILQLAKLGRYSKAMSAIILAVHSKRFELITSFAIACLLLLVSSAMLYLAEGDAQKDSFGSIPRAMWWSVATLTTVGYGDVYPHTILGKIFAGITAVTGIGLIAMPTGILASAFSEVMSQRRLHGRGRGLPAEAEGQVRRLENSADEIRDGRKHVAVE
jgi:voltage-gated potassium channel